MSSFIYERHSMAAAVVARYIRANSFFLEEKE